MAGLLTLSQSSLTKLGSATSIAALFEYDQTDTITADGMQFQYFPESIADTKAVNYQTRDIPGGSLPLYQWISSGERIISFIAQFSSDVDLGARASLGSSGPPATYANLKSQGLQNRNVDVRTALLSLRQYLFPTYLSSGKTPGQPLTLSPQKLHLIFTGSGLGLLGGVPDSTTLADADANTIDGIDCVMTQCDITIESLFPSGMIRLASVQLSFAQIAQLGGIVNFPTLQDATNVRDNGIPNQLAPYPLKVTWNNGVDAPTTPSDWNG
jgi:hypothetical protein